jgi:hypothetical protein
MIKMKAIKFATSVSVGTSEELYLSERKPCDIYFDETNDRYVVVDHKTQREVWVHTTNVQWVEPMERRGDLISASDKSAGGQGRRRTT